METTRLGWAGIELEHEGATLVIDPIEGLGSLAPLANGGVDVRPAREGAAGALLTHLHRDHTDAGALGAALAPGAPVLRPEPLAGPRVETGALDESERELAAAGLATAVAQPWDRREIGPFAITALPAVDGFGDPQLSWAVEAGDRRVAHFGDTTFHGHWWLIRERCGPFDVVFLPINGAVCSFPHRQPPSPYPAVLDPEQAATAAAILGARVAVPIHYGELHVPGSYEATEDPEGRFVAACEGHGVEVRVLAPGEGTSARLPRGAGR